MHLSEEQSKEIEALCRAMPITRMVDYGMGADRARQAHQAVREGRPWDVVLEEMAFDDIARARAAADTETSCEAWHAAAASLIFAQMAFNSDTARKRALYRDVTQCFENFAARAQQAVTKIDVPYRNGRLFGWRFRPGAGAVSASVIVFGGMSGWSTAYRSMAEALCANGIACLLVDGPGQGESRIEGGIYADAEAPKGFSRFVDVALEESVRVGIWGNSYGGLLAALTASADPRIAACCVNGAPLRTQVPAFRTAQEQLAAMFNCRDAQALTDIVAPLAFNAEKNALACPVLVLEGGADPLVPLGSQRGFLAGNNHPLSRVVTWADGEHTIYNHAAERNALVADWFRSALAP